MSRFTFVGFLLIFILGVISPVFADDEQDDIGLSREMKVEIDYLTLNQQRIPDSVILRAKELLGSLTEEQSHARARLLRVLGNANFHLNNDRQALEYFEQSISLYRKLKMKTGIGAVLNNIGLVRERQNDYDGALRSYTEAAVLFQEESNDDYLSLVYVRLGNVYNILGRYDKALEYHALALKISEKANDSIRIARAYNNIGNVYLGIDDFKDAMVFYGKSIVLVKKINQTEILAPLYNNMGLALEGLKEYDKALDYYRMSFELARKDNNQMVLINSLINTGNVYLVRKEIDQAMISMMEAQRLVNGSQDRFLNATVASKIGQLYLEKGNFDESIVNFKQALSFSNDMNLFPLLLEVYRGMAEAFEGKGDFKRAYEYLTLHATIADSTYDQKSNERLNRLRVGFESQNIERDNQLLKQENIYSQLALKRQQIIRNLLIVISIIVVLSAFFLYLLYQSKNQKNKLLAERNMQVIRQKDELNQLYKEQYKLNETKNKFFSIVAHDLKSPFQTILGFSELLSFEYANLTEQQRVDAASNILKVSNETFRLIENLLEWGRTQTGAANATFKVFNVRELVLKTLPVFDPQLEKKNLKIISDLPPLLQAWADPDMIMAVLRNLLSNAIKFSPLGSGITINSRMTQNMIYISVVDTGGGIPDEIKDRLFTLDPNVQRAGTQGERGTGLGLTLCKEFMELNDGNIEFESTPGIGSTFSIVMHSLNSIRKK
jgi:signal transduction histidine kinase